MIGNAPASHITGVPGWETQAEQEYIAALAHMVPKDGTIVEIGGEWGMSASLFSYGADPSVSIFTVDTFQGSMLESHRANLKEAKLGANNRQIVGDSKLVVTQWDQPIDLLFVDGDHSYAGAKADLVNWTPFIKELGLLLIHDCAIVSNPMPHHLHFEVTRAVTEWLNEQQGQWVPLKPVDTMMVFRRVAVAQGGSNNTEKAESKAGNVAQDEKLGSQAENEHKAIPKPKPATKNKGGRPRKNK